MKKTDQKYLFYLLVSIFLTLGLSVSMQPLLADWIEPNAPPPQENLGTPIWNISPDPNDYWLGLETAISNDFFVSKGGVEYFFASTSVLSPQIGIGTDIPTFPPLANLHIASESGEFGATNDLTQNYTGLRIENTVGTDSIWDIRSQHWEDAGGFGTQYYGALNGSLAFWGGEEFALPYPEKYRLAMQGFPATQTKLFVGHIDSQHSYHTATSVDIFGGSHPDLQVRAVGSDDYMQFNIENNYSEIRWGDDQEDEFRMVWDNSQGDEAEIITIKYNNPEGHWAVGINQDNPTYHFQLLGSIGYTGSVIGISDTRLKEVNKEYKRGLDAIMNLNLVYYNFKKDNELNLDTEEEYVGLLAQEVEKVIPEAVGEFKDGYKTLNNDTIYITMLNAIKEIAEAICVEDPGNEICK